MLQGFFGCISQFELEDIDVFGSLYHRIGTSTGTADFCSGVLPHEFEYEIKDHLVVAFCLCVQLVREISKEGLQAGEEGIDIAMF